MENKIQLLKQRDFGEIFSDVFAFFRESFKPFIRIFIVFVAPFIVILSVINAGVTKSVFTNLISVIKGNAVLESNTQSPLMVAALYILTIFVSLSIISSVYSFLSIYNEKDCQEIKIGDVVARATASIWRIIGAFFLLGIAAGIFVAIIAFIGGVLGMASPALVFLLIPLLLVAIVYFVIKLIFVLVAIVVEEINVFEAISRSWELTKEHFWFILGVILVFGIIVGIMQSLISLPLAGYAAITSFNEIHENTGIDIIMYILSAATNLTTYYIGILSHFAIGFLYFSIVEKKEGVGLLEKIQNVEINTEATE